MSEQLIDVLKFGLLALLYLFFLRVIWAVWTELRAPAAVEAESAKRARRTVGAATGGRGGRSSRSEPSTIRVLEPAEFAGGSFPLVAEMSMGRAPGCTVVVDDTYASQLHARVFSQDGDFHLEDLGSTNGTLHNGTAVSGPQRLALGDRIQVGNWVLELA